MRQAIIGPAMLLGLSTMLSAKPVDDYVYGPPPDWTRYRALGETAIRAALPDPDRWTIDWPHFYAPRGWTHRMKARGYTTCAVLNAVDPNRHHPVRMVVVVIDHDTVQGVDISPGASNDLAEVMCGAAVKQGILKPAPAAQDQSDQSIALLGLMIRPMLEGAYIASVTPNGPAASAGLTPGLVITRVNGIPLAGMGAAMAKVLGSDTPDLAIETVTGAKLTLHPAR